MSDALSKAITRLETDLDEMDPPAVMEERSGSTSKKIKIQREDTEIMKRFFKLPEDCDPDDYFEYATPADDERNKKSHQAAKRFLGAIGWSMM
jgi:hypothetical protein